MFAKSDLIALTVLGFAAARFRPGVTAGPDAFVSH